jgi:hypothetical protein
VMSQKAIKLDIAGMKKSKSYGRLKKKGTI